MGITILLHNCGCGVLGENKILKMKYWFPWFVFDNSLLYIYAFLLFKARRGSTTQMMVLITL